MDDFPTAATVWQYLEGQSCQRFRTGQQRPDGHTVYTVQIWRTGTLLATGEHVNLQQASSRALLDAVQLLPPPRPAPPLITRPRRALIGAPGS